MTLEMHYREKYEDGKAEGMQKGIEKGMQKGKAEGMQSEKLATVKRLLEMGILSLEEIARATGLTLERVKEMAR